MRILLTNDDGIYAKGIEAIYEALNQDHDVTVVAPETEQSAIGHAITWLDPLRVMTVHRNGSFFGHALRGTPADCVKLALREMLDPPPDVVVSGINKGANVGVNLLYSGTVSAATEAALLGVPSVAVSIASFNPVDFSAATEFVPGLLQLIAEHGLPAGVCLNVNVPNLPAREIRGVRVTHQGEFKISESYDRRIDPRGHVYYWLINSAVVHDPDPAADSSVLEANYISVTPIHHNLTRFDMLDVLKGWKIERPEPGHNS